MRSLIAGACDVQLDVKIVPKGVNRAFVISLHRFVISQHDFAGFGFVLACFRRGADGVYPSALLEGNAMLGRCVFGDYPCVGNQRWGFPGRVAQRTDGRDRAKTTHGDSASLR